MGPTQALSFLMVVLLPANAKLFQSHSGMLRDTRLRISGSSFSNPGQVCGDKVREREAQSTCAWFDSQADG